MGAKIKALGIRNSQQVVDKTKNAADYNLNLIHIKEEDFTDCTIALTKISQFYADIQLYKIILINFSEYNSIIDYYKKLPYQKLMALIFARIAILDINRVLLNLLSSVRMYLDHTETTTHRKYGDTSPIYTNFRRACSDAYDNQFSYRFLYKLRNYAQHCGSPLSEFHISSREHPERAGDPFHELSFGLSRESALSNFDWGTQINEELKLKPDIIDVAQYVPLLILSITQINKVYAQDVSSNLLNEALYIKNLTDNVGYKETDMEIGIYDIEVEKDDNGKMSFHSFIEKRIPMEVVKAILNNDLVWILEP